MLLGDLFTSLVYTDVLCREPRSLPELSPSLNSKCPKPNSSSLLPEGSPPSPRPLFPGVPPSAGCQAQGALHLVAFYVHQLLLSSKFNPGLFQSCPFLWLLPYLSLHPFTHVFILFKKLYLFLAVLGLRGCAWAISSRRN